MFICERLVFCLLPCMQSALLFALAICLTFLAHWEPLLTRWQVMHLLTVHAENDRNWNLIGSSAPLE